MRRFFVYILCNERRTVLYTGSTVDIAIRIDQHRSGVPGSFSARYNVFKLVYVQSFPTLSSAREVERKIKGWTRKKKIKLIESRNPDWKDLGNGL